MKQFPVSTENQCWTENKTVGGSDGKVTMKEVDRIDKIIQVLN